MGHRPESPAGSLSELPGFSFAEKLQIQSSARSEVPWITLLPQLACCVLHVTQWMSSGQELTRKQCVLQIFTVFAKLPVLLVYISSI